MSLVTLMVSIVALIILCRLAVSVKRDEHCFRVFLIFGWWFFLFLVHKVHLAFRGLVSFHGFLLFMAWG